MNMWLFDRFVPALGILILFGFFGMACAAALVIAAVAHFL